VIRSHRRLMATHMEKEMSARGPSDYLGGYSPLDGSVEFYGRVSAIVKPSDIVVDLGAGRGAWFEDDRCEFRRRLRTLKGQVARVYGVDVGDAVLTNRSTDENRLIKDGRLPFQDGSIDVIVCDYVLEHISDPKQFEAEVFRVLRPGGAFCGRTPHYWNYVSIGARLVKNRQHSKVLRFLQPHRKAEDVFPTAYACNSLAAVRSVWDESRWMNYSYLYSAEPSYFLGRLSVFRLLSLAHKLLPAFLTGNVFAFLVKRASVGV
jgi:SAM-dependent methyltransferase